MMMMMFHSSMRLRRQVRTAEIRGRQMLQRSDMLIVLKSGNAEWRAMGVANDKEAVARTSRRERREGRSM